MKKQFLRVLSILLSLALFLGIVPTAALTVLAEALTPEEGKAVALSDVEVTPENMWVKIVYTGEGVNPLDDAFASVDAETANGWTEDVRSTWNWTIEAGAYDEDGNEVQVPGTFEYLWCYSLSGGSWDDVVDGVPLGMTPGQWTPKVNQHRENDPEDWYCINLAARQEGWTSATNVNVLKTWGELAGFAADYFTPYSFEAYVRYIPEQGEPVYMDHYESLQRVGFYESFSLCEPEFDQINTFPVNWTRGGRVTNHTIKAPIGEYCTPLVYQVSIQDTELDITMGPGVCCGMSTSGRCGCYQTLLMRLNDGVSVEDFDSSNPDFTLVTPIGMDSEEWATLVGECVGNAQEIYQRLYYDWWGFSGDDRVILYTKETLLTGEHGSEYVSSNIEDYVEYTVVPLTVKECYKSGVDEDGYIEDIYYQVFNLGEPVTIIPVLPGEDGSDEEDPPAPAVPVFREAEPLPAEYIVGLDPNEGTIEVACTATYGSYPISYQWYRSETNDYNGVAVTDEEANQRQYHAKVPNSENLNKAYYYYCEYSFVNINGVTETYYTTILKCQRVGATGLNVTVRPGEIYMGESPTNTDNFVAYYDRYTANSLDLFDPDDYKVPYAYQSKGSDSVLSAWIQPSVGYGAFKYSDYITYQWYKSDKRDYTTGERIGETVTVSGLDQFSNSRTSVSGLRSYADFNEVNQHANIHIDCPTDEVGTFYMTVVVKNYYTTADGKQHVFETSSTCRVTTFEKNEELYQVNNEGQLFAYNGHEAVLTIPAEVDGKKVTSIGKLASQVEGIVEDPEVRHVAGARKIVFPEGVTEIGDYAFARLMTLEEIEFSNTINSIGKMAFADTGYIQDLVIPKNITFIDSNAFRYARVQAVTFADDTWCELGNTTFYHSHLKKVVFPANATGVLPGTGSAFLGCTNLVQVENYQNIIDFAPTENFRGTPAWEYLSKGNGGCDGNFIYILNPDGASWCVTEIVGDNVENATIPETYKGLPVTVLGRGYGLWGEANMEDACVVRNPLALKSVTIPATITTINADAFNGCENLVSFNFQDNISFVGERAFQSCYRLTSDVVLADEAQVYEYAFYDCRSITRLSAHGVQLFRQSFDRCYSLEFISEYTHLLPPEDGTAYIEGYVYSNFWGAKAFTDYSELSVRYWKPDGEGTPSDADTFKRTGDYIYRVKNNKAIHYVYAGVYDTKITFPSTLDGYKADKVDGYVFHAMLTDGYEVVFEEGITTLGYNGGDYPNRTVKVTLPESLVELNNFFGGNSAQDGAPLKEIHIPAGIKDFSVEQTNADVGAFRYCRQLEKVTFADNSAITVIAEQTFYRCEALRLVEFENLVNLETIEEWAFYQTAMETVDLTANTKLKTIGDNAFEVMPNLKAVRLPVGIETIGERAFAASEWTGDNHLYVSAMNPLTELVLPEGLKKIGARAFYGRFMDNAKNEPFVLDLPNSLETIAGEAFAGYYITVYNDETLVSNIVLADDKLPSNLRIFGGAPSVSTTYGGPFAYSNVEELIFPAGIEELRTRATYYMPNLTKIVFEGGREGISSLGVLEQDSLAGDGVVGPMIEGWDYLRNLARVEDPGFGTAWEYEQDNYTIPSTLKKIGSSALGGWDGTFRNITIPDGVQSIGWNAMSCISTPDKPNKIIALGKGGSAPVLDDKWLQYDRSVIEEYGYDLAPLYCYTDSSYHEWAVKHNYPYILMDEGTNTIVLKFYDTSNKRLVDIDYFQSIVWTDKDGNEIGTGDVLRDITVGEEYTYTMKFYDSKSWDYCLPFTSGTVTAIEGGASVNLTITTLKNMTLTGTFANQAEPGFTVQVQSRQSSTSEDWYTVSTLTMADLGVDGSFSLQVPVKDVRLVMNVTGVTKLAQTEKIYLSRSGRLENGVMDLGEIKMDYKGAEPDIRVNGDLSRVPNLYLKTEDGTSYAVVTTTGYIHIREAIKAGVKAGETVTLYSAYENGYSAYDFQGPYYIDPFTFTVPYDDDGTILDVEVKHAVRIDIAPVTEGVVYIFDESGKVVIEAVFDTYYIEASGSYYTLPGKYTMVAVSRPRNVSWKFKMLADFEALGVAEDNYIREEFTVEAGAHKVIECTIPAFNYNDGSVVTSVWVEYSQYDPYTGLAPVYVQYNDANAVDGNYVVRIRNTSSTEIESSFAEIEGKYAFGDNVVSAKVEFTVSEDLFSGDNLLVTLDASQALFCFYAPMDGRSLTVYIDAPEEGEEQVEEFLTCCYITMPKYEFSLGPMPEVTDQNHGEVSVLAPADLRYKAVVYVDDTAKEYERKGSTSLPYSFKTYTDGASEHTVQVVIYSLGGQLLWQSNVYTIRHDRKYNEMSQPQKIDITYAVDTQSPARGAVYFNTGVISPPVLTIFEATALDGYVIKHPVEMRYSLTMSNPDLIIGETVTLVVYFCKDSPYTIDVNLAFNPATGTFDGKLEWEANTFSILEMPYGFDIQYTCESAKSKISPTFRQEQAEAALAEREALMAMVGKQYTPFDLEELQKDLDADETLTPTEREEWMAYAAFMNKGVQLLNDMSVDIGSVDFQTSLAEVQKIWTDLMANMEIISLADDPPTAQELLDEGYTYHDLNGTPMYIFASDVSTVVVYLDEDAPENSFMLMIFDEFSTFSSEGDDDSMWDDAFQKFLTWVNTGLEYADEKISEHWTQNETVKEFDEWAKQYDAYQFEGKYDELNYNSYGGRTRKEREEMKASFEAMKKALGEGFDKDMHELQQGLRDFKKMLNAGDIRGAAKMAQSLKGVVRVTSTAAKVIPGGVGTAISVAALAVDAGMVIVDAYDTYLWMNKQADKITDYYVDYWKHCLKENCYDQKKAEDLLGDVDRIETRFWLKASAYYVARVATMAGDAIASFASGANVLAGTIIGGAFSVASMFEDTMFDKMKDAAEDDYTNTYRDMIRALPPRCTTECPSGGGGGGGSGSSSPKDNNPSKEPDQLFPAKNLNVRLDPSGYVYEAVASNRIEGATAKVYYLDENGNEVYWEDAAAYDEVNPQITDANGKYGWMVPIGKWKVRVTKDGYYDADSTKDPAADENGWLPVPPPQTAVHIGMVSKAAPVIDSVQVAEDTMQVIFSQYMDIAHLMSSDYLLRVFADGAQVPVKLEFADAEVSPTKEGVYYGRILNITRTDGQQFVGEDITLVVNGDVRNYAGTAMGTDYNSGKMSVGQVADALSHSYPNRLVMAILDNVDVALQVTDTNGKPMAGVEVTMKTAVGDFLTVNNTTAVSDENGRVVFAVSGRAAGTEFLTFTTANGITAEMEVRVDTTTVATLNKPTANLSDYSVVDCGTQLIISTNVENGIIYYTTNDTCPCTESENRKVYTGPIDLTESAFYRIAVWTEEDGYSERLNLHLTVEHDYAEDGVTCNRCGSSEGDDPIVEDIITFDGYSVSEDVNGLAFRFTIDVTGMTQKGTTAVYDNAKVMYNGQEYSLVGMGAIVSNDADAELTRENIDGVQTIDVFAKYLWSMDEDSASYAVRVIDIPENGKDTTVYARAYFVIEVEGEQVVVYADDIAEQTYNGVLNG